MPDMTELGKRVKAKYKGAYDDLPDEEVGRRIKAKYPGAYDDFTDRPAGPVMATPADTAAQQALIDQYSQGFGGAMLTRLGEAGGNIINFAEDLYNRPGQTLERVGRSAANLAASGLPGGGIGVQAAQEPRLQQLRQEAAPLRSDVGRTILQGVARRDEMPRTLGGKIGNVAGAILAGPVNVTPESLPLDLALNVAGGAAIKAGGQAIKAGVSAVGKRFGKGAAQIIEAEAAPAAIAQAARQVDEIAETAPRLQVRQKRGQLGPEPGAGAREVRPDSTLYDPLEAGGFFEETAEAAAKVPTRRDRIVSFLDTQEQAARARIAERRNPAVLRDVTSIAPDVIDYSIIGAAKIGRGAIKYEQFAEEMVSEFGEEIKPRLKAIYDESKRYYDETLRRPDEEIPTGFGGVAPKDAPPLFDFAPNMAVPKQVLQRAKDEFFGGLGALKATKSSIDISAPFRQGGLLLLRPFQWRQAGKAWGSMFRAFSEKEFKQIKEGLDFHPNAKAMEDAGLYLANRADDTALNRGEEAFLSRSGSKISEVVEKTPGIKQSQQAYTTYLDVARVEAFKQYKNAIDKAGLSTAETLKGYKAAAEFINLATGRGSLGKGALGRTLEGLNYFIFSPRYVASRFQVLNPAMYLKNLSSPGGRVVLKEQFKDLVQVAGTVATTMYIAKSAGADVNLDPESADFLKIKVGNTRYDPLSGLQQVMRLSYRVSEDIARAARKEKPKFGKTAIDIGETFLSYKLSPPAAVFRDFINQRTVAGKPFGYGRAAIDAVAPIQWADFVDAWREEGLGQAAMTLPGAVGVGVQQYSKPDPVNQAIERSQPLFSELQRLKIQVAPLNRRKDEADDAFNGRVQQFSQSYTQFGQELLNNPRFQSAPNDIKTAALKSLNNRAKQLTYEEFPDIEGVLNSDFILDAIEEAAEKKPGR